MSGHRKGRIRLRRVAETVRHALAEILQREEIHDLLLAEAVVTISAVEVSPDLRHARVLVMPAEGLDSQELVAALNRHRRFLRGRLAPRLRMKYLPELTFRLDEQFAAAQRVERLLQSERVRRDLEGGDADAPLARGQE